MPRGASRGAAAAVLVAAAAVGFGGGAMIATGEVGGTASPGPAASRTPEPTGSPTDEAATAISLSAEPTSVGANETVRLTGRLEPPAGGVSLQVQRSLDGGDWSDFPVTATTREDGSIDITVESGRAGENRFRLTGQVNGQEVVSDEVAVTIG